MRSISAGSAPEGVVLNATGYIVAAHKIEVAAKVIGKVKWIGVDKGDLVREGPGACPAGRRRVSGPAAAGQRPACHLQAKLDEALHGSRPEEIAQALANLEHGARPIWKTPVTLDRTKRLRQGRRVGRSRRWTTRRHVTIARVHRVNSLQKAYELVKLGPAQGGDRCAARPGGAGQGALAYAETNLANTIIRAPVTGTILERAVEKGEFVTTSFVGDRGAKGYVVSLADLNDLEVELDISQNDFAKLHANQHGIVTTDAFPDRKYDGFIKEISPEANRQKATVQVKVKVVQAG